MLLPLILVARQEGRIRKRKCTARKRKKNIAARVSNLDFNRVIRSVQCVCVCVPVTQCVCVAASNVCWLKGPAMHYFHNHFTVIRDAPRSLSFFDAFLKGQTVATHKTIALGKLPVQDNRLSTSQASNFFSCACTSHCITHTAL